MLKLELGMRRLKKVELVMISAEHVVDNDIFEDVLCTLAAESSVLSQAQLELENAKIEAEMKKAETKIEKN